MGIAIVSGYCQKISNSRHIRIVNPEDNAQIKARRLGSLGAPNNDNKLPTNSSPSAAIPQATVIPIIINLLCLIFIYQSCGGSGAVGTGEFFLNLNLFQGTSNPMEA